MGVSAFMRIIDQEIETSGRQELIPIVVTQALNGLSGMAVCIQEISQHHNFLPSYEQHALLVKGLEEE